MSNLIKTISFLKRNGIKNTCYTIKERLDKKNLEQIQVELKDYQGARYYASIERQAHEEATRSFQKQSEFKERFLFSILVPAYETDKQFLIEMMDSVMQQTYARVELIIADASKSDNVEETVRAYEKETLSKLEHDADGYPCIRYVRLKENAGISENTNVALEQAKGDYIGLLDHDDVLTYDALYEMMVKLQEKPYAFLYSDEDKADGLMTRFHTPHIKPDINRQLLLSNNYICHFAVLRSDVIKKLRFRKEFDGAQDYDLFLRALLLVGEEKIAHVDKILYHWRCHEASTAANPESKRYAYEAGKRALEEFLAKKGIKACVNHSKHLGFYSIKYEKTIFKNWEDIGAICGKVIYKGRVIGGPVLKGRVLFKGLLENYSGYMHRAHFTLEVDEMDERAATFSPKYRKKFEELEKEGKTLSFKEKEEYVKAQGDKLVYVPFLFLF